MLLTLLLLACPGDPAPRAAPSTTTEAPSDSREPMPGDIVFQESDSGQAAAVRAATGSRFGHVGLVHRRDGRLEVLEAVEPVRSIPWERWLAHGVDGKVVVKRLRDRPITDADITAMTNVARPWIGRHYDGRFEWKDDRLYCSELVWKVYAQGIGVELVATRPLRSYDLSRPEVQALIATRFSGASPNPEEPVVSPGDLYDSPLLETVRDDFAAR